MAQKRLKIAFLSFFSGLVDRGVETIIKELSPRLSKTHDVVVYQAGQSDQADYKVEYIPTEWKPDILQETLNFRRRLFLDKTSLAIREFTVKVIPKLKEKKFDIIVPWNNGWQTLMVRTSGVGKTVVVGQSGLGWDDRVNLWLFPDCFVGFTSYQVRWAKRVNPFIKTAVIPNGVDTSIFKPTGKKISFNLPKPIILSVAALVSMKRLDLAIKAVARLGEGSLLLVGKGEFKNKLQQLGDKLLPDRFKIIDLPYSRINEVYRSVDLFTFPTSSWESFGIVLLEAMASKLPIVANDDPIRREIIGNAGLFVDPQDTEAYTQTIKEALKINWNRKPREQAQKFSWDKIAEKYERLFEEMLR